MYNFIDEGFFYPLYLQKSTLTKLFIRKFIIKS